MLRRAGRGWRRSRGLRDHAPPLEGKGHPADVGTGAEVSDFGQVAVKVIDEGALEAQRLQQLADPLLQAAGAVDPGPEGLGDAQVQAHHDHLQLSGGRLGGSGLDRGQSRGGKAPQFSRLQGRPWGSVQGKRSCVCGWARKDEHSAPFPEPVLRQVSLIPLSKPPHSAEPSSDSCISQ